MKKNDFYRTQFTFHRSWMTAMSYIRSKAVRNRLTAAIIEYGMNRTHTPIGNAVADAIMVLVMDQIDRECGGNDEATSSEMNSDTLSPESETTLDGGDDSVRLECSEDIREAIDSTTDAEVSSDEEDAADGGEEEPSSSVDIAVRAKRKSKSCKKKLQARRRKNRR